MFIIFIVLTITLPFIIYYGVHGAYYCNEAMKKSKNADIKALHNEIIEYDENAPDICVLIS